MREALRAFLVALSVIVQLLAASPAGAEMIATPRPDPQDREAALHGATLRLPGESLRSLPTVELLLLANAPEAFVHAANDAVVALLVVACVVLFVTTIIVVVIISRVERHLRHIHGEREGEPGPLPSKRASK